jgi:hypothetical protein
VRPSAVTWMRVYTFKCVTQYARVKRDRNADDGCRDPKIGPMSDKTKKTGEVGRVGMG